MSEYVRAKIGYKISAKKWKQFVSWYPTVRLPKENKSEVVIKGYEMKPMVLKYK